MILNVGAGNDAYGDVRGDLYPSRHTDVVLDIENGLPFKNEVFREVYSKNLLEHLRNVFSAVFEMKRVLESHGRIVIITDNAAYIPYYLSVRSLHCRMGYRGRGPEDRHYALFTKDHLLNLMRALDLRVLECSYVSFDEWGGKRAARPLTRFLMFAIGLVGSWSHLTFPRIKLVAQKLLTTSNHD